MIFKYLKSKPFNKSNWIDSGIRFSICDHYLNKDIKSIIYKRLATFLEKPISYDNFIVTMVKPDKMFSTDLTYLVGYGTSFYNKKYFAKISEIPKIKKSENIIKAPIYPTINLNFDF